MPRCHLTKEFVEEVKNTPVTKRTMFLDTELKTLVLEMRPVCKGTWYFRERGADGKFTMQRLGPLQKMSLYQARLKGWELQKKLNANGNGSDPLFPQGADLCLEHFIYEYYLPYVQTRKRSWKSELGMLRRYVLPILGDMSMKDVTSLDLFHWQDILRQKGLAATTCNRSLFLIKYIFNSAQRWGHIPESPARDVSSLPEEDFRERYLSNEEARRLLEVLNTETNISAAHVIRLLLFTGARKSEILSARWENVNMERRMLTVPLSKSGRARHIPLSDAALQIFKELPRDSEWVFPSNRTKHHMTSVFSVWNKVRRKAGLEDVRMHDLRHSFASFLINSGCSLYEVQRILGHHDPKVTTRYAHLTQDSLLKAANIVADKIGIYQHKKTYRQKPCH